MMIRATRRGIFGVAAGALVALGWRAARADAWAGSVVGILGQCTLVRQGRATVLKLADAVAISDTIQVPADGKLKLRMSDGSVISLASGTRITITAYQTAANGQRQNATLSLGEGLLRAVVAPVDRPANFEVLTAVGTAAVRSTDWFIETRPGLARVGVLVGSVSLASAATGYSVLIPSRYGARVEAGRDPVPPSVWKPEEFAAVIARTNVP